MTSQVTVRHPPPTARSASLPGAVSKPVSSHRSTRTLRPPGRGHGPSDHRCRDPQGRRRGRPGLRRQDPGWHQPAYLPGATVAVDPGRCADHRRRHGHRRALQLHRPPLPLRRDVSRNGPGPHRAPAVVQPRLHVPARLRPEHRTRTYPDLDGRRALLRLQIPLREKQDGQQ